MGETAAKWLRVSRKVQDEASQDPDLTRWCEAHDYDVKREYIVHGLSAFKGKHQKTLDQMFKDMEAGVFTVLVVWKQDRIERRGMEAALSLVSRAKRAGGRIEFVTEPHLNKLNDMGGRISYAIMAEVANAESQTKSDRIKAKHVTLRGKGSWIGRVPFGYEIEMQDGIKTLVPTELGKEWVPAIYRMAAEGKSRLAIVEALKAGGVQTMNKNAAWSQQGVSVLIKNPVYYGAPRNNPLADVEPLVTAFEWQAANYALESRSNWRGRGTTKHERALLKPLCGTCFDQRGERTPMYRVPLKVHYYRCQSKATANPCSAPMVRCDELDRIVTETALSDHSHRIVTEFVPGDSNADEVAKLQGQIEAAAKAKDFVKVAELSGEALKLSEQPSQPAHLRRKIAETTVGEWFATLDLDGRREFLTEYEIVARTETDEDDKYVRVTMVHKSFLTVGTEDA